MTRKIAFRAFRDAPSAPCDEDRLGKTRVGVFDFNKSELNATFVKVFD